MASEATVGLMLWDGESRGTLMNVLRLSLQRKPVVVYVGPKKAFVEVRTHAGFEALVARLDHESLQRLRAQAANEERVVTQATLHV